MLALFPKNDKAQTIRVTRQLMANLFFIVCFIVFWVASKANLVEMTRGQLLFYLFVVACTQITFFAIIRSGINKRFKDPSLTLAQIISAVIFISCFMFFLQAIRGGFMALYLMVILFGAFQFKRHEFIIVSLVAVAGYSTVIILNVISPPANFELPLNIVQLIILALALSWVTFIGSYLSQIRESLKGKRGELQNNRSQLIDTIQAIKINAETLDNSSVDLSNLSNEMSQGASEVSTFSDSVAASHEQFSDNAKSVAASMGQLANNADMVATSVDEMTNTINEIVQNTNSAQKIALDSVSQSQSVAGKVQKLGQAANEVGTVTETIKDISDQTNLLALNATIEAARAGEMGKGFSVVANEIKELAKQTADATEVIRKQIDDIQGATTETVQEISQISNIINELNDFVTIIASSVEEQSASTKEIAANVAQSSQGITEINENMVQSSIAAEKISKDILEVNQAAGDIANRSTKVNTNAEEFMHLAKKLHDMTGKYDEL